MQPILSNELPRQLTVSSQDKLLILNSQSKIPLRFPLRGSPFFDLEELGRSMDLEIEEIKIDDPLLTKEVFSVEEYRE
jgi:hypothetical protein